MAKPKEAILLPAAETATAAKTKTKTKKKDKKKNKNNTTPIENTTTEETKTTQEGQADYEGQALDFLNKIMKEKRDDAVLDEAEEAVSEDIAAIVETDAQELRNIVSDLKTKASELRTHLKSTSENAKADTSKGLTLLDVKNHTLLQYIIHLVYFIYLKLDGERIEDHPVIDRLIEFRIVIEKMKPLEQKLKYQIDKLVKTAMIAEAEGVEAARREGPDPLNFRPNPMNLVGEDGMEEEEGDDTVVETKKTGIYRPPKLAPVAYEENPSAVQRRKKHEDRVRDRMSKSRLMQDLAVEFDDRPEEAAADGVAAIRHGDADVDKIRDRDAYEEENLVRLVESKKDMKMRQRAEEKRLQDDLKNLSDFGSLAGIRAMEKQNEDAFNLLNRRKPHRRGDHHEADDDDDDDEEQSSRGKRKRTVDEFDGMLGNVKRGKSEFQKKKDKMGKKNHKKGKARR